MKQYRAPNGKVITGLKETVPAIATIQGFSSEGPVYAGQTDMIWDEQAPVMKDGGFIYVCEDGEEWSLNQLSEYNEAED